jgi:hypothetical protein
MTFRPEEADNFLKLFNSQKEKIRAFPGCQYLELWQDHTHHNVFTTHSHWDGMEDLQNYRNSSLFKEVWSQTKVLFSERAEAHSYESRIKVSN